MKYLHTGFFFLLLFPLPTFAQKWDYQWPMGYEFQSTTIPDISLLDFTGDTVSVYNYAFVNNLSFGATASFICNVEGQLLLLTNNCAVYDADFQLVSGTNILTPEGYDDYCNGGGYIGKQSTVFLPQISNDSIIYLAHKDNIVYNTTESVLSTKLYLSTLVKKTDNTYYLKEKRQLLNGLYNYSHLTACIHVDNNKWWTGMIGYNTNKFYWFLVGGQDTVQGPIVQEIGVPLINNDIGISQSAFSPDATMLASNADVLKQIYLYGFDNATGEMSNPQEIPYPAGVDDIGLGVGFSFDSRLIYATTNNDLYQIDLQDNNSIEHIAHHASLDEDNWPVNMGNITLGPDCRMYIGPGSTTYYIHVVHHPNEKGAACGFEARALRSPANIDIDIPNLPMYRFNGACDSTIQFPYKDTVSATVHDFKDGGVKLFPNPVQDYVTVSFPVQPPAGASLQIFDGLGRPCFKRTLPALNNVFNTVGMAPGLYFYGVKDGERLLQTGKLVKVEL